MGHLNRRENDRLQNQPGDMVYIRKDREMVRECINLKIKPPVEVAVKQRIKDFLNHEFDNPVPRFIRAFIDTVLFRK